LVSTTPSEDEHKGGESPRNTVATCNCNWTLAKGDRDVHVCSFEDAHDWSGKSRGHSMSHCAVVE
jgi:hypothetical protein